MVMQRRALLLVNRNSRRGREESGDAGTCLRNRGLTVIDAVTDDARQVADVIRHYAATIDLVVLAGGDGTLNAAADTLAVSGLPVGIIPAGTANDLARTLGIPTEIEAACSIVAEGRLHPIDLGWVNDKHFFNVASMGLSTRVTKGLSRDLKRRWGVLGYAVSAVRAVREAKPFWAEIECDGRLHRLRSVQVSVGNGRHYGGGMTVADDAAIDDGMLNLYSVRPQSLWRYAALLPAMRAGRHGAWDTVDTLKGREFAIRTDRPLAISTDGEITTGTPARFRIVPGALSVFVPQGAAAPGLEAAHAAR